MLTGAPIPTSALESLSVLLLERAGLRIASDGFRSLRWALGERMPALGLTDAELYVRRLREPGGEEELRALLPHVTVTHTEFFRDARQFQALERRVLPELLSRARGEKRPLRIWSAGCATGEEPYSLAIVLEELGARPVEVDLWATDLNTSAVEAARQGRFPPRRVLPVTPARRERCFEPVADGFQLCERLREFVRFEAHNLAAPVFEPVRPASLDLVLCRNVIIYFSPHTIQGLLDRFFEALRPGGVLVLGYSESLFRVYERFEMVEVEGAFLYRRPLGPARAGEERVAPPPISPRTTSPLPRSTLVTQPCAAPRPQAAPLPVQAAAANPDERAAAAAALAERGQFDEAIEALRALLREHPHHLPSRLSLGNLHSLMGKVDEAQSVFARALQDEPLCVEARLFAAMAQVQVGRFEAAREELQKALFLEPTLALAHSLAAQVHERLGDAAAARRAYRNALAQLHAPQRRLAGFYPDLPDSPELVFRAARYALAALEEVSD